MPIYEYRCRRCRRRFTKFFRSFSVVVDPGSCPSCGASEVERLLSRVVVRRGSGGHQGAADEDAWEGAGEWSEADGDISDEGPDLPDLPDTEDPREFARWARDVAARAGEPLEPEFERALQELERGEDPERVLERLEEATAEEAAREESGSGEVEFSD
ncbi:MAG: hypothetical protein N2Z82_05130 [Thermomicrobium sp.]|nr:hypothetical protein [Thermomicrobium sp.]